jgi:hypothetical protein
MTKYTVTHELLGENVVPVTAAQIAEMVQEWDTEGWTYRVVEMMDTVRIYADRDGSEDLSPSAEWIVIDPDTAYIVVAEIAG